MPFETWNDIRHMLGHALNNDSHLAFKDRYITPFWVFWISESKTRHFVDTVE